MNLLVPIDLSSSSKIIADKAVEFAKALAAKIYLLHVVDPEPEFLGFNYGPESSRKHLSEKIKKERNHLHEFVADYENSAVEIVPISSQGSTSETILEEAEKLSADLIIIGSHGRNAMYQLLVGSVSEGVLHKSKLPVLVVPTHSR